MRKIVIILCCGFGKFAMLLAQPSELMVTCSKIKEGHLQDVRDWMNVLSSQKEEVLQTFKNEKTLVESAFIKEIGSSHYLIYYWLVEDLQKAREAYRQSTLPIDDFHKKCWAQYTEQHELLSPVFHLVNLE
jgi:hypothetical protein